MICYKVLNVLRRETLRLNVRSYSAIINEYEYNYNTSSNKLFSTIHCPKLSNVRHLSLQGFVEWQQQTYTSISSSYLVNVMQDSLLYFHSASGLSWWATIVTSTILIRASMTLPLAIYQNYILAKVENASLEFQSLIDELKRETAMAKKMYNLTDKQTFYLFKSSMKKQWSNIIVRDNCHPFKASLVILLQIPIWVCMSFALRNIVYMQPVADSAALIALTEMTVGGFGWIPNLTQPDHSYVIPVAFGISNLAIIEVQQMSKLRKPSRTYKIFTNIFRGFSILMVPLAANVPSCMCLYWFTSSSFGLLQNIILLSPSLRRKLKIPEAPSELEKPYNHIRDEIKAKLQRIVLRKKDI